MEPLPGLVMEILIARKQKAVPLYSAALSAAQWANALLGEGALAAMPIGG